jgi:hypothetical protein
MIIDDDDDDEGGYVALPHAAAEPPRGVLSDSESEDELLTMRRDQDLRSRLDLEEDEESFAPAAEGAEAEEAEEEADVAEAKSMFDSLSLNEQNRLQNMFGPGVRAFFTAPTTQTAAAAEPAAVTKAEQARLERKQRRERSLLQTVTDDVPERLQARKHARDGLDRCSAAARSLLTRRTEAEAIVDAVLYPADPAAMPADAQTKGDLRPYGPMREPMADVRSAVVREVETVLRLLHDDGLEVGYLVTYCIATFPRLTAEDLTLVDAWDSRWAASLQRKVGLIDRAVAVGVADSLGGVDVASFTAYAPPGTDDHLLEHIARATSAKALDQAHQYLVNLESAAQARRTGMGSAVVVKSEPGAGDAMDDADHVVKAEPGLEADEPQPQYSWLVAPALDAPWATRMAWLAAVIAGLHPLQLRDILFHAQPIALPVPPADLAALVESLVTTRFPDAEAVLARARSLAASQMAADPLVVQDCLRRFSQVATLHTFPTQRGLRELDLSHPHHLARRVQGMTVHNVLQRPDLFLAMHAAAREGLVTLHAHHLPPRQRPLTQEEHIASWAFLPAAAVPPLDLQRPEWRLDATPDEDHVMGHVARVLQGGVGDDPALASPAQQLYYEQLHAYVAGMLPEDQRHTFPLSRFNDQMYWLTGQRGLVAQEALRALILPRVRERFLAETLLTAQERLARMIAQTSLSARLLTAPYHPALAGRYAPTDYYLGKRPSTPADQAAVTRMRMLGGFDWCVASAVQGAPADAFVIAFLSPLGDEVEHLVLPHLKARVGAGAGEGLASLSRSEADNVVRAKKQEDVEKLRAAVEKWRPSVILLDLSSGHSNGFRQDLVNKLLAGLTVTVTLANPDTGRVFAQSPRAAAEFKGKGLHPHLLQAIGTAREVLNPLAELSALCTPISPAHPALELSLLDLHPHQALVPDAVFHRVCAQQVAAAVAHVGVDLNAVVGSVKGGLGCVASITSRPIRAHMLPMLEFVPGLGKYKARALATLVHRMGGVNARLHFLADTVPEDVSLGMGLTEQVFRCAAGFLRVSPLAMQTQCPPSIHPFRPAPGVEDITWSKQGVGGVGGNVIVKPEPTAAGLKAEPGYSGPEELVPITTRELPDADRRSLEAALRFHACERTRVPPENFLVALRVARYLAPIVLLDQAPDISRLPADQSDDPEVHSAQMALVDAVAYATAREGVDRDLMVRAGQHSSVAEWIRQQGSDFDKDLGVLVALELHAPYARVRGHGRWHDFVYMPSTGTTHGEPQGPVRFQLCSGERMEAFKRGSVIHPRVRSIAPAGVTVELPSGLRGFVPVKCMSDAPYRDNEVLSPADQQQQRLKFVSERVQVGQPLPCRVMAVHADKLSLDLSARPVDVARPAHEEYIAEVAQHLPFVCLGPHEDDAILQPAASAAPVAVAHRSIHHPAFLNVSCAAAEKILFVAAAAGSRDKVVVRPDATDMDRIVVSWRLPAPTTAQEAAAFDLEDDFQNAVAMGALLEAGASDEDQTRQPLAHRLPALAPLYLHIAVEELDKPADRALLGRRLRLPGLATELQDLDQLIVTAIEPMLALTHRLVRDRHFSLLPRPELLELLKSRLAAQPRVVPTALAMHPTRTALVEFVALATNGKLIRERARVTPKGFVYCPIDGDVHAAALAKLPHLGGPRASPDALVALMKQVLTVRSQQPALNAPQQPYGGFAQPGAPTHLAQPMGMGVGAGMAYGQQPQHPYGQPPQQPYGQQPQQPYGSYFPQDQPPQAAYAPSQVQVPPPPNPYPQTGYRGY